jgi:hypothetical protein
VVGPVIYNRIVELRAQQTYLSVGPPPDSDFDGRPLGFLWNGTYLEVGPIVNLMFSVNSISIYGKNFGPKEVTIDEAYLLSAIDSTRVSLQINAFPEGIIDIKDASPVPESASFQLRAQFGVGGLPEGEFLKTWSSFYVIVEANGEKIRHLINRQVIRGQLDRSHPELTPHVSKRK